MKNPFFGARFTYAQAILIGIIGVIVGIGLLFTQISYWGQYLSSNQLSSLKQKYIDANISLTTKNMLSTFLHNASTHGGLVTTQNIVKQDQKIFSELGNISKLVHKLCAVSIACSHP